MDTMICKDIKIKILLWLCSSASVGYDNVDWVTYGITDYKSTEYIQSAY